MSTCVADYNALGASVEEFHATSTEVIMEGDFPWSKLTGKLKVLAFCHCIKCFTYTKDKLYRQSNQMRLLHKNVLLFTLHMLLFMHLLREELIFVGEILLILKTPIV